VVHFFPKKVEELFLVVVSRYVYATLNIQMSKQRGKKFGSWSGAPSHGTTGTMVNPALYVYYQEM